MVTHPRGPGRSGLGGKFPPGSSHRQGSERATGAGLAAEAFDVKTGFQPGQGMHFPPWTRAAMVRAERIDDLRFEAEGPAEVLEPTF